MTETISTEIFNCKGVSAFIIPPGDLSISQWNNYDSNYVWKGHLKLIEHEMYHESETAALPIDRIALKLELLNSPKDVWAIAWYNPTHETDRVKYNEVETIERTESARLFKIIVQFPDTEYNGSKKLVHKQVALGLRFEEKIDAYVFLERLTGYKTQFLVGFVEQYNYENSLGLDKLSLDDKDDDFGDFVG